MKLPYGVPRIFFQIEHQDSSQQGTLILEEDIPHRDSRDASTLELHIHPLYEVCGQSILIGTVYRAYEEWL
jgi:hypothetical protein